jgi:hypothetical protein
LEKIIYRRTYTMAKLLELVQKELDVKKYEESKATGKDLCGAYSYCKYCSKKNKYPCAAAYLKEKKAA